MRSLMGGLVRWRRAFAIWFFLGVEGVANLAEEASTLNERSYWDLGRPCDNLSSYA